MKKNGTEKKAFCCYPLTQLNRTVALGSREQSDETERESVIVSMNRK